ncbi:MAG TPA: cell division protein FtsL [Gammaproteobacteria bacterium]|nr:cell division protein FtsL [Gammaproteobacteria bacterium]
MTGRRLLVALLVPAVFVSALGVVYVKHLNRRHFAELQQLRQERDQLEIEWGQLQLEQSAWATHPRIEQVAREALDMTLPANPEIVVVMP